MTRENCPECKVGHLYERRDGRFTIKTCFGCGYYWNDSEGYSELSKRLFKEYLPTEVGWDASPIMGQGFKTPKEWTEPNGTTALCGLSSLPEEPDERTVHGPHGPGLPVLVHGEWD